MGARSAMASAATARSSHGTSRSVACIEMPPRLAEKCSEAPRFDPS